MTGVQRRHLDIAPLVRPRSIAVIGGSAAAEVVRQCRRMDFAGPIYPVHPRRETLEGLPCYARIADLPEAPDAAFVGVNRQATIEVLRELRARGTGGAVCFASGFRESGNDGAALQEALIDAAGDMPVLGPNTYGLINYLDGALLWPDQHGGVRRENGVALLTQSSNIAINLSMNRRGLPISYIVTLGNQAQVGMSDMIRAIAADSRVTAIGLLIEGFDDVERFALAVNEARAHGVPVVVLKAGTSDAGAELAMSHTASLGGATQRVGAVLDRLGVGRVESLNAFLETLKLLHTGGPLQGTDIVSLSCSGGEAILMADAGGRHGMNFRPFTEAQRGAIRETVSDLVTISNPFDYHMFMWGNRPAMARTFSAVMEADYDLTCLVLDLPRGDRCDDSLWRPSMEALVDAHETTGARAAMISTLPEGLPEDVAEQCVAGGVTPFIGLDDAMTAIRTAAFIGRHAARDRESWSPVVTPLRGTDAILLSEPDAKARLAAADVPVPAGRFVPRESGAGTVVAGADAIGYPVVVKAASAALAHKSEAGAVALGLTSGEAVLRAAERMADLGDGWLVERMIDDGVAELLVGYEHDPMLGGFLTLASGGVLVELVGDSRVLPLPVTAEDVREALAALRVNRLIAGYRGHSAGDGEALVDAVLAIGRYCTERAEMLVELEVNPLIVRPRGYGVVAADALIREAIARGEEEES